MSLTKKNILSLFLVIASLTITACNNTKLNSDASTNLVGKNSVQNEVHSELLAAKMLQADYTWIGINDKKTVKKVLEHSAQRSVNDKYVQCIYENIDRKNYKRESNEVASYLTKTYPNDINAYIFRLGSLKPIVEKIFYHPKPVTFNKSNMLNSSALQILETRQAVLLDNTIKDKRYGPLLASIGLPAMSADNVIQDFSVNQIGSLIQRVLEAKPNCS